MRISEALKQIHDEHKMMTTAPLVIEFSHYWALNKFMQRIEDDAGMPAGELKIARIRAGWDCDMFDGIEFRVKPRKPPLSGVGFWPETKLDPRGPSAA